MSSMSTSTSSSSSSSSAAAAAVKVEGGAAGEEVGGGGGAGRKPVLLGAAMPAVHDSTRPPPPTTQNHAPSAGPTLGQMASVAQPTPPQQEGGEVFKKPADTAASKKSPVSVETTNLQLPPCMSDVEMLSAQSTDGSKAMDTMSMSHSSLPEKQEREKEAKEKKEHKTISEDTKALVKQALLSHRQRTESCGDDDKPRPVTAAQRQREREEKRKKKRDSKMKKIQEKKKDAQQKVELSDADKELLARWSSMQKKELPPTTTATTPASQSSTPPAAAIVYLNPAPSPPQVSSPPHPTPSSTPPSLLPVGMIPHQGQMALVTAGPPASQQGQVMLSQGLQGQPALPQPGSRSMVSESGPLMPLEDLHRHSNGGGGQLQISRTQAEALKEALGMIQGERRRSGEGGEAAADPRALHTPLLQGGRDPAHLSPTSPDPSGSPQHSSPSPGLGQRTPRSPHSSFTPPGSCRTPPGMMFTQPPPTLNTHAPSPFQASFAPPGGGGGNRGGNTTPLPQNLVEFLERHCQKPEPGGALTAGEVQGSETFTPADGFRTSDVKMNAFGAAAEVDHCGAAVNGGGVEKLKSEDHGFGSCRYFPATALKPESEFPDKGFIMSQQDTTRLNASASLNPLCGFQSSGAFPLGSGNSISSSSSGSMCYPVQTLSMAGPLPQPYFLPSIAGVTAYHPPHHPVQTNAGLPFPGQGGVDASSHVTLPFSRYTDSAADFQMLCSRDGGLQGTFGGVVASHPAPPHGAMASHAGMVHPAAVVAASHHGLGPVVPAGPPHPTLPQAGGPHQSSSPSASQPVSGMVPGESYAQPQNFQTPMQTLASAHGVPHPHHLPPHHHLQHYPLPQEGERRGGGGGRWGPGLRVSAPKQDEVDLVAMLSNRLSSIFPPSLSLTPRGTGAGYGVGMDLDVLMADAAADNAGRGGELSPLSSSLLADWLDLSSNISQADLDALEQDFGMTSPMAMSYTDFHPSNAGGGGGSNNANWG